MHAFSGERETDAMKGGLRHMTDQRPTHQQVAARAYQIYLERGRQSGHEIDDWLQAEYELMRLPVRKLAELESRAPTKGRARKSIVDLVRAAMY
jgi:hypothetical protein